MELFEAIHTRRSIRRFTDKPVPEEIVDRLLRAAMAAPSAQNGQQWCFLALTDRAVLDKTANSVAPFKMLNEAQAAILVIGDLAKVNPGSTVFMQSCSAATQNILLAAHGSGLGACWIGVYPLKDRVAALVEQFSLPETVAPFSLVALGYPGEQKGPEDRYNTDMVHMNKW